MTGCTWSNMRALTPHCPGGRRACWMRCSFSLLILTTCASSAACCVAMASIRADICSSVSALRRARTVRRASFPDLKQAKKPVSVRHLTSRKDSHAGMTGTNAIVTAMTMTSRSVSLLTWLLSTKGMHADQGWQLPAQCTGLRGAQPSRVLLIQHIYQHM